MRHFQKRVTLYVLNYQRCRLLRRFIKDCKQLAVDVSVGVTATPNPQLFAAGYKPKTSLFSARYF